MEVMKGMMALAVTVCLGFAACTDEPISSTIEGNAGGRNIHGTFSGNLTNLADSSEGLAVSNGDFGLLLQ